MMGRKLQLDSRLFTVVHGEVERYTDNLRHVHAWVETEISGSKFCLNFSDGEIVLFPKEVYYKSGKVGKTVSYNSRAFSQMVVAHGHWGPWDEDLNRVQEKALQTEDNHGL